MEAPQSFVQDTEGKVLGQVLGLHNTHIYICMCVYVHSIEMLVALKMELENKNKTTVNYFASLKTDHKINSNQCQINSKDFF